MKQTYPAPLPYKDAPLDLHDMLMRQLEIDDAKRIRYVPTPLPPHNPKPSVLTFTATVAHAFAQGVYKETISFLRP